MGFRDDREALDARVRALEEDVRRATRALDANRDTDLEVRRLRKQLETARGTILELREHTLRRRLDVARLAVAGLVAALVLVSAASAASIYGMHLDAAAARDALAETRLPPPLALTSAPPLRTTAETLAPSLRATTLSGTAFDLAALRGRVVVIDFGASWVAPYATQLPVVESLVHATTARGTSAVHVFQDSSDDDVQRLVALVGVTGSVIRDHDHSLATAWGPSTMPTTYVVDRHGVVRHTHFGFRASDAPTLAHEIDTLLAEP